MSIPVMLALSMSMSLFGSVSRKLFAQNTTGSAAGIFWLSSICSVMSMLVLVLMAGFHQASVFTWLLGIAFGIVNMLQTVTQMKALECGPMSYTMVILYCSTVISAVSGALFWNEQIQLAHVIGIVLMLISFVLAVKKQPGEKNVSLRWLLLSLGAFATTGGIGVMQKLHQSTEFKGELNEFLVIAFGTATLLSALYLVLMAAKKQLKPAQQTVRIQWLLLAIMVLSGVSGALCNQWNLYLSGVMDSAVFFPLVNGGGLVLTTLAAVVIFKEKLSKQQWLGVIFGIASVIFLCNPF